MNLPAFICMSSLLLGCATIEQLPSLQDGESVRLEGKGVALGGYLFKPTQTNAPAPAIIVLHGWGGSAWTTSDVARALSHEGYVALALSMRGWNGSGGKDDCGRNQPHDIVKAVTWLAAHPLVDSTRLGVIGFSQGGQVALLSAARTTRIKAVAAYFPVTDINEWRRTTSYELTKVYIDYNCKPGGTHARAPVNFADQINAAVLLLHGEADTRVPLSQSLRMKSALEQAGKLVEFEIIKNAEHIFTRDQEQEAWPLVTAFFARHLKQR